jgi:cysteine desulfurase
MIRSYFKRLSSTAKVTEAVLKKGFEEPSIVQKPGRPIYLDFQATTPMDPRVLDAMLPFMTHLQGNPHSRTHKYGWESVDAVEAARKVWE